MNIIKEFKNYLVNLRKKFRLIIQKNENLFKFACEKICSMLINFITNTNQVLKIIAENQTNEVLVACF